MPGHRKKLLQRSKTGREEARRSRGREMRSTTEESRPGNAKHHEGVETDKCEAPRRSRCREMRSSTQESRLTNAKHYGGVEGGNAKHHFKKSYKLQRRRRDIT